MRLLKVFSFSEIDAPIGADYRTFATKTPIGLQKIRRQELWRKNIIGKGMVIFELHEMTETQNI